MAGGDTPLDPTVGARSREEVDDPIGVHVIKNEIFGKPVFSSSRGLFDLVTDVNKSMTVCTRQCSVSLPLGLGILPYGSKPTADSSPPDVEDSSPSDEEDSSSSDEESLTGQFLVEIFEVSANFPFFGTIIVSDEHSSEIICDNWEQTYNDFYSRRDKWVSRGNAAVEFKDKMELIGPSRATTADTGFVIKVHTPGTSRKASKIRKLTCNTDDDISLYNQVRTHTMKINRGHLYVTCSVLSDVLEGFVEVLVQLPNHWRGVAGATIYGLVTARFEKFDIGSTLFKKDFENAVALEVSPHDALCSKEGYSCMKVPLMRTILAVPLGEYLNINGKLQVCGYDAMPINIDHRIHIPIDCENVKTPWIKGGESLSAFRMWLRPIF